MVDVSAKTLKKKKPLRVSNKISQVRWNKEQSEEMHGGDYCIDFHFFIKSRNPQNILDKIEDIFDQRIFKAPLSKHEIVKGHVAGTINDYILVTYTTSRAPDKFSFDWTDLPVIPDKNLSNNYKKHGNIEDYIKRFL